MPLIDLPVDSISEADLQRLIDNGVGEGPNLEHKRTTYGGTDQDRSAFLADISRECASHQGALNNIAGNMPPGMRGKYSAGDIPASEFLRGWRERIERGHEKFAQQYGEDKPPSSMIGRALDDHRDAIRQSADSVRASAAALAGGGPEGGKPEGEAHHPNFGVGRRGGGMSGKGFAGDLLEEGRRAGVVGQPMKHQVEGSAHLRIDVNGPQRTQAKMQKMDGMFKSVQVNRGKAAPVAKQDG